jgi:hypothetical protein
VEHSPTIPLNHYPGHPKIIGARNVLLERVDQL